MSDNSQHKNVASPPISRKRIHLGGIVQGVGFRPFVFRLAAHLGLAGFVNNDPGGVLVEIEGSPDRVLSFTRRLTDEAPVLSRITSVDIEDIDCQGQAGFSILESRAESRPHTLISPDIAVCDDCLAELFDPNGRRYRYPFINCTNCGPRYTIVESIPYDRPRTSMKVFPMCPDCDSEYRDPANRRFHAQPNACRRCGPRLVLRDRDRVIESEDPIADVVGMLRDGKIAAIRGLGGFHLAVDARNTGAIERLRERKGRARKPFALMAPDLSAIEKFCHVTSAENDLLTHHTRPIVLLRRKPDCPLPENIAPRNNYLGFMLPYTPLHHLLLKDSFDALIMTSGNYSEEPIAVGNDEAIERLRDIADLFLLHNREILQRCDDSIAYQASDTPQVIRRARGYVPQPVFLPYESSRSVLACGGELKNTIALSRSDQVFLSQHIGDLDNPSALAFFENSIEHLGRILEIEPQAVAYDMHPEYLSTKWAVRQSLPGIAVQHHHAHLVSVMADNGVTDPTIGIILDGTGYGTDGTIWGGEILVGDASRFKRHAWLEPVAMPGGTAAIKEPWRMAVSYLYKVYGSEYSELMLPVNEAIEPDRRRTLTDMIQKEINCPITSSCGRLFDAVSAILGIRYEVNFEAQAAIELEMAASPDCPESESGLPATGYRGALETGGLVRRIVDGLHRGESVGRLAADFHVSLAEIFVNAALAAREESSINRVGLSGGVFQNRYFAEYLVGRLKRENFEILMHRHVPTNDGGLALGQIVVADRQLAARDNTAKG